MHIFFDFFHLLIIKKQIHCVYILFINIFYVYIEKKTKSCTLFLRDTLHATGNLLKNREHFGSTNFNY